MLEEKQVEKMLFKLKRFEDALEPLLFEKIGQVEMSMYQTSESLYAIPCRGNYTPCKDGDVWGGEGNYCWFAGTYTVPEEYAGKSLYIYPKIEGYEALLWVNGRPFGTFCSNMVVTTHGNHYCNLLKSNVKAGEKIEIDLEYYAGHYVKGCMPFEDKGRKNFSHVFHSVDICLKNEKISEFLFDLKTLNQLVKALDKNSYRRADIINALKKAHSILYYSYEDVSREKFMAALEEAGALLKEKLMRTNSETAPYAGLIGHSHMDTAWLWHIGETIKKCARTYSNQISLMEQYPEHRFIQSSAYHGKMIKEHYPQLFEEIKKKVSEGRYEPNGGVWVECDCNIISGESMIRQFLWGQRFTRENFNYTSDTFWLPDTFGYSPSIPQIMKGCGLDYFVTTKLSWNDHSDFPYDTFYWKGLDGTRVLVHFPKTHDWPCPETLAYYMYNGDKHNDVVKEKTVSNMKLIGYGYGDGGGGPQFEMIEMSRRIKDLEGVPRTEHTTVGSFMRKLEASAVNPPEYSGELYLELHRGTLTNQHEIKRNNRIAEIRLHDLEYAVVRRAVEERIAADGGDVRPLMETLLVNQFHDILPGTGIPRVNKECIEAVGTVISRAEKLISEINGIPSGNSVSVINTLSFDRNDVIYLDVPEGFIVSGAYAQQVITGLDGKRKLAVSGLAVPAFSSVSLGLVPGEPCNKSPFILKRNELVSPYARITFDENGFIDSFVDLRNNRELRGSGHPLNTFLIAEDVPSRWDSWDLDADCEMKFRPEARLLTREIVSDGAVELRIRSNYRLTEKSTLAQDMIVYANSPEIRFETVMDWNDNHRFLKVAFDTTIFTDFSREEVQFGYIRRPTTRNTVEEKAKFEVSNHKYSDISESRYGVAILNDCKYGISVKDSSLRLSLHKGGCNPDYTGDKGIHKCTYSFLPHNSGFSAESVVKPAYMLNYRHITGNCPASGSMLAIDADNVIVETVKPCEDAQNGYILRIYEAEGTYTNAVLTINHPVDGIFTTNMLEENPVLITESKNADLCFRPFEIKTVLVRYPV